MQFTINRQTVTKNIPWIILIVIGIVAIWWYVFRKVKEPVQPTIIQQSVQHQTDSILKVDKIIFHTADSVRNKVIDSLKSLNLNADERIKKINHNVEKKILIYDTLPPAELQRILTNRYR